MRVTPASAARADILRHGEGAYGVALATEDSFAVHHALAERSIIVDVPAGFGRPVLLPDGTHDAQFRTVQLPPVPAPPNLFACQHLTRDLVWRPEWMAHPNGALRVSEIILSHADPGALGADYAGVFGSAAIEMTGQGWRLALGNVCLSVNRPAALAARFAAVVLPNELDDWFAGAAIAVRSLEVIVPLLQSQGIPYVTLAEGIVVPLVAANGTLLLFHD